MRAQLKTLREEELQSCFRKWQEHGISIFEARVRVLRGIHGNVSFSVRYYLNLSIHTVKSYLMDRRMLRTVDRRIGLSQPESPRGLAPHVPRGCCTAWFEDHWPRPPHTTNGVTCVLQMVTPPSRPVS